MSERDTNKKEEGKNIILLANDNTWTLRVGVAQNPTVHPDVHARLDDLIQTASAPRK